MDLLRTPGEWVFWGDVAYGATVHVTLHRPLCILQRQPVRDHGRHSAVEEVQDPVVNASHTEAQSVDPIEQEVGRYSASTLPAA